MPDGDREPVREKIQMENQYYELKAMYEADMARQGRRPIVAPSVAPGNMNGPVIYEQGSIQPGDTPGLISNSPGLAPNFASQSMSTNSAEMASYIHSVEVVQLPAISNETLRLLVRPLDDQGAILPLAGDIKIRMYDPVSGVTLFEDQFASDTVVGWINDQPGLQPGIHIALLQDYSRGESDLLVCDLQYRTADNRVLKQSSNVTFQLGSSTSGRRRGPGSTILHAGTAGIGN